MKTTVLNDMPDFPARRFAKLYLTTAISYSSSAIVFHMHDELCISIDDGLLAPPPLHLMNHIIDAYRKMAFYIYWPKPRSVNGKYFQTLYEGKKQVWSLSSPDLSKELTIKRIK